LVGRSSVCYYFTLDVGIGGRYTCGAAAFPPAHAMKVIARVVDFFVCPATFREMSENSMFPSARVNCVQ
jgi:hypothetical protein